MAVNRVCQRVKEGGHNIPTEIIYRRYYAGLNNLFNIYMPCVNYWLLVDNSVSPRVTIAEGIHGKENNIYNMERYNEIKRYVKQRI